MTISRLSLSQYKFKIGDRVKFVEHEKDWTNCLKIGHIYTVSQIDDDETLRLAELGVDYEGSGKLNMGERWFDFHSFVKEDEKKEVKISWDNLTPKKRKESLKEIGESTVYALVKWCDLPIVVRVRLYKRGLKNNVK